jgi:adenylyltransferase/sulfurtransferase
MPFENPPHMDRYSRQSLLHSIGESGQKRLREARIAVVGLGALGCASAECLARAGVGELLLVDRDILELTNLSRQLLYDEKDVEEGLPKAFAAKRRLGEINSELRITAFPENLHAGNVRRLLDGVHLIVDGTDNIETRYLLNDYAVSTNTPWIYGGAVGTSGTGLFVLPGVGPCLRCVYEEPPDAGKLGTCDTVGILGTVPVIVGAWQASMAIRHIVSSGEPQGGRLFVVDLWQHGFLEPEVKRREECPACGRGQFPFLSVSRRTMAVSLCGRGAFQVTPPVERNLQLEELSRKLAALGHVEVRPYYLVFSDGRAHMCLFQNGGAQVTGVGSEEEAMSFYARYVGM